MNKINANYQVYSMELVSSPNVFSLYGIRKNAAVEGTLRRIKGCNDVVFYDRVAEKDYVKFNYNYVRAIETFRFKSVQRTVGEENNNWKNIYVREMSSNICDNDSLMFKQVLKSTLFYIGKDKEEFVTKYATLVFPISTPKMFIVMPGTDKEKISEVMGISHFPHTVIILKTNKDRYIIRDGCINQFVKSTINESYFSVTSYLEFISSLDSETTIIPTFGFTDITDMAVILSFPLLTLQHQDPQHEYSDVDRFKMAILSSRAKVELKNQEKKIVEIVEVASVNKKEEEERKWEEKDGKIKEKEKEGN